MIRTITVFVLALIALFGTSLAQPEKDMKAGGGIVYQNDNSLLGIEARGLYYFSDKWAAQVGATYYVVGADEGLTYYDLAFNVRYDILNQKKLSIYANLGYLMYAVSQDTESQLSDVSNTANLLNMAVGLDIPVTDMLDIYGEICIPYLLDEDGGLRTFFRIGVYYNL